MTDNVNCRLCGTKHLTKYDKLYCQSLIENKVISYG